jgi:formylglycine-generating enzyme required for sulfatase activity
VSIPQPSPARFNWKLVFPGVIAVTALAIILWPRGTFSPEKSSDPPVAPPRAAPAQGEVRTNPADGVGYVWINPGTFTMGCSPSDRECDNDETPHHVTLTSGFLIGRTEVTQAAFEKVTGKNPSNFKGPQRPVEAVTWTEAKAYCEAVNLRLPTEAEWRAAGRRPPDMATCS